MLNNVKAIASFISIFMLWRDAKSLHSLDDLGTKMSKIDLIIPH